jgi:hypothetical protein
MKRTLKYVVLATLIAIAAVFMFALSACGSDSGKATEYSVKVVYADGTAVKGSEGEYERPDGSYTSSPLKAQWCLVLANGDTSTCYPGVVLDEEGKATSGKLPELGTGERYHVQLNNVPQGYTYDEEATYVTEFGELLITLTQV